MATKVLLGGELMFPSDYLAACEFKGKDVTLTIAGVQRQDLKMQGGKVDNKPVLTFKETKKKLIYNKTNAGSIAQMYGTEANAWVGKRVTFYPTRTACGKDTVDCVRVREKVPGGSAAPANSEPETEDTRDFSEEGASL